MIKIHNVRAGFATNSSSSHSIVMLPPGEKVATDEYDRFSYGWEQFTLADADSKTAYLAVQLKHALENRDIDTSTAVNLINSWLGTRYCETDLHEGYVDHQSVWGIFNGELGMNPDFIRGYHNWLNKDEVVILGGNDNSDPQPSPLGSFTTDLTRLADTVGSTTRIKQDQGHWILFEPHSGNKVRFSLDDSVPEYEKATTPELVDVKITNKCPYECSFCYQSSTPDGVHANWDNVQATLSALAQLDVFEIAFGGGETTQFPQLPEALKMTRDLGMVPNLTTYGVDWLKNTKLVEAVRTHAGALGVSVHTVRDLNKVSKISDVINNPPTRQWGDRFVDVIAQHVVGTLEVGETAQLLEQSWQMGIPMLLLGYKNVGFGTSQTPHDMTGIDALLRLQADRVKRPHYAAKFYTLGVDTSFVDQFGKVLEEIEVPQVLVTNGEGKFSMYVDCVEMRQGPSSYMPERMTSLDTANLTNCIKTAFATY